ncbi:hypothetical protein [Dysgonomonas sp. 511]|uniref:LIC_10190 family membrane protein n=1 Tax=Dysgonomonas sp. 511 TaxID=2302930 RepID=UPI0013D1D563|nr:hypothetical protein [Dysgonomonas sp. 511]
MYWWKNKEALAEKIKKGKSFIKRLSTIEKCAAILPVVSLLLYCYIPDQFYDAEYYHYQQIRWNEEFKVVPGLANLEDRFGFNSNYLLVSAIFTFRFLFKEAHYTLQSVVFLCMIYWTLASFITSGHKVQYIVLFFLFSLVFLTQSYMFGASSTDIIPILCSLYYLTKIIISPDVVKKQPLLIFLLPVLLVTFKLSSGILGLVCIYICVYLIKQKKYKHFLFLLSASVFIIVPWLIRNIIVSGYLVYPVYIVDIFSFDWKVPETSTILQYIHVENYAKDMFSLTFHNFLSLKPGDTINFVFFIIISISPLFVSYLYWKNKIVNRYLAIYLFIMTCIIFSLYTAPDFRFFYGYLLAGIFLLYILIFPLQGKSRRISILGNCSFCLIISAWLFLSVNKFIDATNHINLQFTKISDIAMLYRQRGVKILSSFREYKLGEHTIYITYKKEDNRTFDVIPATSPYGIPYEPFIGLRMQDIRTIETRGENIGDGFRTKKEYIDIIERNREKYIEEYYLYWKNTQ